MPITKDETSFIFEPELPEDITKSDKKKILDDIGDYLVTEILSYIGDGVSPVSGYGKFKKLSKEYADSQKDGDRSPILELHGDMLSSLTYKIVGDSVVVGIFDDDQAIKSYNHNVGDTLPQRKFIPDKGEKLKKDIESYIDNIIESYLND